MTLSIPNRTLVLVALGGAIAMTSGMGIGRFVYTPILPVMVEGLHMSKGEAGLIASANYIGYFLAAMLGTIRLPFSRRFWFAAALIGNALATGLMGFASDLNSFLIIRFVGGMMSAFILVFGSSIVFEKLSLAGRPQLNWIFFAGVGTGITLSAVLVAALSHAGYDWRMMWYASSAVTALGCLLALSFTKGEGLTNTHAHPAAAHGTSNAGYILVVIGYGLLGFGYVISATFLVAMTRLEPTLRFLEPVIWVLVGLSALPSSYAWNRIADRIGMLNACIIGYLIEAAGVAASVLWISPTGIIFAALTLGGTFVGITSIGFTAARQMSPMDPRRNAGIMTAAFALAQIIGPLIAGYSFDHSGSFKTSALLAAGALLISALTTFWAKRYAKAL